MGLVAEVDLHETCVGRLLFRSRPTRIGEYAAAAYLIVVALAPRLPLEPIPGYAVGLDDLMWLGLMGSALLCRAPRAALALPMAAALFVGALSILSGLLWASVGALGPSLLTLLKTAQLFSVYLAARALGVSLERISRAAALALLGIAAIAAVDVAIHARQLTAPRLLPFRIFDNALFPGQTNHIASFIALAVPVLLIPSGRDRLLRISAVILGTATLLLAASRTAILALFVAIVLTVLLSRVRWEAVLLCLLAAGGVLGYGSMKKRLSWLGDEPYYLQLALEKKIHGFPPTYTEGRFRLVVAWIALDEFRRVPLLGTGVGSRHRIFYESAYVMVLAETGLLGLGAALMLGIALLGITGSDPPVRAAYLALLGVFLLVGFGAVTPVITRLAAPFWIYVAAFEGRGRDERDGDGSSFRGSCRM